MISELHKKWLEGRGLTAEIAEHMGCYSGMREQDGSVSLNENGDIFVFPFIRHGVEVGAKYRGPQKVFWQKKMETSGFSMRTYWKTQWFNRGKLPLSLRKVK